MPSLINYLVTVDTRCVPKFVPAIPVSEGPIDRDSTVFQVLAEDEGLSFIGTYDELIAYAVAIMQSAYSWALHSHHSEWFGDEQQSAESEPENASTLSYTSPRGSEHQRNHSKGYGFLPGDDAA